jgi:hypothetical protein
VFLTKIKKVNKSPFYVIHIQMSATQQSLKFSLIFIALVIFSLKSLTYLGYFKRHNVQTLTVNCLGHCYTYISLFTHVNQPAHVISEELLDAELPKETPQETSSGIVKTSTAALCSKDDDDDDDDDDEVSSSAKDEQNISSAQWFQLSDRLGAKVTSGSVLDRLGVKKITHESNSPLLRVTDRISDKIIAPVSDRLGGKKMKCDDVTDSNQSANRRSISVLSQPQRHSVSVAQVTPTTVRTVSRMVNVDTETEQFGPKMMQRPLDEDETAGKDQVRGWKVLLLIFRPVRIE